MGWAARSRSGQGSLQNRVEEGRKVGFAKSEMGTSRARTVWSELACGV